MLAHIPAVSLKFPAAGPLIIAMAMLQVDNEEENQYTPEKLQRLESRGGLETPPKDKRSTNFWVEFHKDCWAADTPDGLTPDPGSDGLASDALASNALASDALHRPPARPLARALFEVRRAKWQESDIGTRARKSQPKRARSSRVRGLCQRVRGRQANMIV